MAKTDDITVTPASFPEEKADVAALFREYAASLSVDLAFQAFEAEVEGLPGAYQRPGGCLLVAREGSQILGCIALRRLTNQTGEIKRLYVRPAGRGHGLGARLIEGIVGEARTSNYNHLLLDTLPEMMAAQALYRTLGFRSVPAYTFNPVPGASYYRLDL